MKCADVKKMLVEDVDSAERSEIRDHLNQCGKCGELRRQLVEIEELNQALARAAGAPRGFSGKVAQEAKRAYRFRTGWRILSLAVAGVSLLALALQWSDGLPASARQVADQIAGESREGEIPADLNFGQALETHRFVRGPGVSYIEVVIPQASGDSTIVRVPSTIQIRRTNAVDGPLTKVSY